MLKRLHPFQQRAIRLNLLLMAIGCFKLLTSFLLNHDQQRWLSVVLDVSFAVLGLTLAMQIRARIHLQLERQKRSFNAHANSQLHHQG
jgi:hypothetical protein